jgi:hypothetical protein
MRLVHMTAAALVAIALLTPTVHVTAMPCCRQASPAAAASAPAHCHGMSDLAAAPPDTNAMAVPAPCGPDHACCLISFAASPAIPAAGVALPLPVSRELSVSSQGAASLAPERGVASDRGPPRLPLS